MRFEELEKLSHNELFDRFDEIVEVTQKKTAHLRHQTEALCPKDKARKSLVGEFFDCDSSRPRLFRWPSIDLNLASSSALNRLYGARLGRDRAEACEDKKSSETSMHLKLPANGQSFRITHSKGLSTKRNSSRGLHLGSSVDFKHLKVPGIAKRLPVPSIKTKKIY